MPASTRNPLRFGLLAALSLTLGVLLPQPAFAQKKIIINQSAQSLSAAAIYIAADAGFFRKEGLDVEFIATGSGLKSIVPLISGATQFCGCVFSHNINAAQTGAGSTKIIASITNGYAQKVVLQKSVAAKLNLTEASPIADRIKAMKGLKIGISEVNSASDQVTRLVMRQGGLDASRDAELISLGVPNLNAALHNGQIQAFTITAPHPEMAVKEGDAIMLIDLSKDKVGNLSDALYIGLAVDDQYLKDNRDTAVRAVRAIIAAQKFLVENTAEARKILKEKEFPKMEQDVFDISFDSAFPFFAKTAEVSKAGIESAVAVAQQFSKTPLTVTFEQLADPSVVRDASASN